MESNWDENKDRLAVEAVKQAKARQEQLEYERLARIEKRRHLTRVIFKFSAIGVVFFGVLLLLMPMLRRNSSLSIRQRNPLTILTEPPAEKISVAKKTDQPVVNTKLLDEYSQMA